MPIPDPPSRETIGRLIDLIAEAKTCMLIAAATAPSSPEREPRMEELRRAVLEPRRLINEILGRSQKLPQALLVTLRTCELSIPRLAAGAVLRPSPAPSSAHPEKAS